MIEFYSLDELSAGSRAIARGIPGIGTERGEDVDLSINSVAWLALGIQVAAKNLRPGRRGNAPAVKYVGDRRRRAYRGSVALTHPSRWLLVALIVSHSGWHGATSTKL